MKKLKWILLFIMVFLAALFLFATCKKTKALQSEVADSIVMNISSQSQGETGAVFIVNLSNNDSFASSDFLIIGSSVYNINLTNSNNLRLFQGNNIQENVTINSRLLQFNIVEDTGDLYIICYQLYFTFQHNQGLAPIYSGVNRVLTFRSLLSLAFNQWDGQNGLNLSFSSGTIYSSNFLLNCSYVSSGDTPRDINDWVDLQVNNVINQYLITDLYQFGNNDGYNNGYSDGEDRGYSDGYDAGEQDGYDNGYYVGRTEGLEEGEEIGYQQGYDVGYTDGQAGNTAITPVFNTLSGIFSVIGSVLSIELVPHVPIGIFILVPLFFSAVGLILWIWRRN